jgi:hypothetical protein
VACMLLPRPEIRMTSFFIRGFYHSGDGRTAVRRRASH